MATAAAATTCMPLCNLPGSSSSMRFRIACICAAAPVATAGADVARRDLRCACSCVSAAQAKASKQRLWLGVRLPSIACTAMLGMPDFSHTRTTIFGVWLRAQFLRKNEHTNSNNISLHTMAAPEQHHRKGCCNSHHGRPIGHIAQRRGGSR